MFDIAVIDNLTILNVNKRMGAQRHQVIIWTNVDDFH